jgi:hypothetical protein
MRIAIALSLLLTSSVSAAELQGVIRSESSAPLAKAHMYVYAAHPKRSVRTATATAASVAKRMPRASSLAPTPERPRT